MKEKLKKYIKNIHKKYIKLSIELELKKLGITKIEVLGVVYNFQKKVEMVYCKGYYKKQKIFFKYSNLSEIIVNEFENFSLLKKNKKYNPEYFIEYLECLKTKNATILISKFIEGLHLEEIVLKNEEKLIVAEQILEIIKILHAGKLVHRDIYIRNIMVEKENEKLKVKLIDLDSLIDTESNQFNKGRWNTNDWIEGKLYEWDDAEMSLLIFDFLKISKKSLVRKELQNMVGNLVFKR